MEHSKSGEDFLDTERYEPEEQSLRSSETRLRVSRPAVPLKVPAGSTPPRAHLLSDLSHELRSPLASILAYAQLMEREESPRLSTQGADDLASIATLARHALAMVDDLLQASRAPHPDNERRAVVSFSALFERSAQNARRLLGPLPVEVSLLVESGAERGYTDPVKVEQVLNNLLTNAARFTDAGSIMVVIKRNGTRLHLEVRDTGIGIAKEHQSLVFERGRQVAVRGQDRGGTGLGLFIVSRLCAELGGKIGLESRLGSGSRFVVDLPDVFPLAPL